MEQALSISMISQEEYRARRKKLAAKLSADAIAFIPAAKELLRNGDSHYRFRQDSDFYYLTGFNEPDALLVIEGGIAGRSYLFNRSRNLSEEQWTGRRLGQEDAKQVLGVDEAYPLENLSAQLPELIDGKASIYCSIGRYPLIEDQLMSAWVQTKKQARRGIKAPEALSDLEPILSEMRLIKSKAEVNLIRRAAQISVAGHKRAMRACRKSKNESQLEAELIYEFIYSGCHSVAYTPIVGGGANSCVLHYTANNQALKEGELILIDAAGEYENYAADITRTFPINGCFTQEQSLVYELVLKAQQAAIDLIRPGLVWNEMQNKIVQILTAGLCDLGLLKGKVEELINLEAYRPFYMHNSGHWLGLDVHDAGPYKIKGEWRTLEAGMVLTVEPGLYISAGMEGVDRRWWNIGVRIEDDILVTEEGHENLTAALPVELAEIEALLGD